MTQASTALNCGKTSAISRSPSGVNDSSTRRASSGWTVRSTRPLAISVFCTPVRVPLETPASAATWRLSISPQIQITQSTTQPVQVSPCGASTVRSRWFRTAFAAR